MKKREKDGRVMYEGIIDYGLKAELFFRLHAGRWFCPSTEFMHSGLTSLNACGLKKENQTTSSCCTCQPVIDVDFVLSRFIKVLMRP